MFPVTAVQPIPLFFMISAAAVSGPFQHGAAIQADGQFEGEWNDAHRELLANHIALLTKRNQDSIFLGIALLQGQQRYVDLYFENAEGKKTNLHASMQQGERVLPEGNDWTDRVPGFTWGRSSIWHTNTVERANVPPGTPPSEQLKLYEGFEFAIPLSHLGPGPWRMRVEIRDFMGTGADIVWPENSTRHDSANWYPLNP